MKVWWIFVREVGCCEVTRAAVETVRSADVDDVGIFKTRTLTEKGYTRDVSDVIRCSSIAINLPIANLP